MSIYTATVAISNNDNDNDATYCSRLVNLPLFFYFILVLRGYVVEKVIK